MVRRIVLGLLLMVVVASGWVVYRVYPRRVELSLTGVEYKLGSAGFGTKSITLQLNGRLRTGLRGRQSFTGTVNVLGSTVPDKGNERSLTIDFHKDLTGGVLVYFNWETH